MAKEIGLGLKVVDRTDLIKDGDDVISGNALATKKAIDEDRARLSVVEVAAGFENTAQLTDQMVSPLIGDEGTATGAKVAGQIDEGIAGLRRELRVNTLAELQAACAAGGSVIVGNTPIALTSPVMVTAPTKIRGGVFTLPTTAAGPGFHIKASNTSIEGATFTGAGLASGRAPGRRFILAEGTSAAPLGNVKVLNCDMTGCQDENVRLSWCKDSQVSGNTMTDFLYAGVMLISVDGVDVVSNMIRNAPLTTGVVNTYGIAMTDLDNTVAARCKRVKVISNTVEDIEWEGIDTHGGDTLTIIGNQVRGCPRGIALVVGNGTRLAVPTNCVVQGNLVDRGTAAGREGIGLFGNSTTGAKADAIITGNTVRGYSSAQSIYTDSIDLLKTLIEGNSHPHIPWTDLVMTNTAQWTANTAYRPQYMIEGRHVYLRGFAINASVGVTSTITNLPQICKVDRPLVFIGVSHGSSATAGFGTLTVGDTGVLQMLYKTTTDGFSYTLEASYIRAFG